MLARGVLCRLAADVPKISTHDLPCLSHLLTTSLHSRNGASFPAVYALSRAYKAALFEYTRSYATSTRATKPTARVRKDVKKETVKKPARKAAAKKPKGKTVATRKAKPKKAAAKPKRAKKVLTPEQKEKQTIKEYKQKALKAPLVKSKVSAWQAFVGEAVKGATGLEDTRGKITEAAAKFKTLTPAEKEHYNHLGNEHTAAKKAEYDAWVRSHTPEKIRIANQARTYLRRKAKDGAKIPKLHLHRLQDDRQVKRPMTPYTRFSAERKRSGDHTGITAIESTKLCASEWKALSASEKKKYEDQFVADFAAYNREFQNTYGHARGAA